MVPIQIRAQTYETITMSPLTVIAKLDTLKTESIEYGKYNTFEHMVIFSCGSVYKSKLTTLIDLWFNDDMLSSIEPIYKAFIVDKLNEYLVHIKDNVYHTQRFDFKFNNRTGKLFVLVLNLQSHPTKQNTIMWTKGLMTTFFESTTSYVIAQHR